MSISEKLNELEDFELAFLMHYKGKEFLKNTQLMLREEANKRGLRQHDLKSLVKEKLATEIQDHRYKVCPSCTSNRISSTREMVRNRMEGYNAIIEKEPEYDHHYYCEICGWDFQKNYTRTEKRTSLIIISAILVLFLIYIWILIYIR